MEMKLEDYFQIVENCTLPVNVLSDPDAGPLHLEWRPARPRSGSSTGFHKGFERLYPASCYRAGLYYTGT